MTKNTNKTDQSQQAKNNQQQASQDLDRLIAKDTQLEIKISWKKVAPVYEQKLKKQAQQLKIKGFRKGKTPLTLAEKEIGFDKIANLAVQELLPKAYEEAVAKGKFLPLTHPEFQAISLNKDNDWIIKAFFAQKPEFEIKNYQKIVKKAKQKAQKNLDQFEKEEKKKSKKDSSSKIKKDLSKKNPEPDKKEMTENQKKDSIVQGIISALVEEIKPPIPRLLIRQNTQREMENLVKRLETLKLDLETFLKSRQMSQEQLSWEMALSSISQLQVEFLLQEIAKQEKISVDQSEVELAISKTEDEKMREQMTKDKGYQRYLQDTLQKQKVIEFLLAL